MSYTRKARMGDRRKGKKTSDMCHPRVGFRQSWPAERNKKKMTDTNRVLCIIFGFDSSPPHIVPSVEPYALPMVCGHSRVQDWAIGMGSPERASAIQRIYKIIIIHKKKKFSNE